MAEFTLEKAKFNTWECSELLKLLRTEALDAFIERETVRGEQLSALHLKVKHSLKEVKK